MPLCNPLFVRKHHSVSNFSPFNVLNSDGTVGSLPDIDSDLRSEDFSISVQTSMGASLPFVSNYVPTSKLQDFEGIINHADLLLSDCFVTDPSNNEPNTIQNES